MYIQEQTPSMLILREIKPLHKFYNNDASTNVLVKFIQKNRSKFGRLLRISIYFFMLSPLPVLNGK